MVKKASLNIASPSYLQPPLARAVQELQFVFQYASQICPQEFFPLKFSTEKESTS